MTNTTLTQLLIGMALACVAVVADCKPHEHGAVRLDISMEGSTLTIGMNAALDNWLGFERAPRTEAERKAAAEVLARLRNPAQGTPLFTADATAQCKLARAEVSAPALEPGAQFTTKSAAKAGAADHADLEATYEFQCAQPANLRMLELGLFDAYKRIQRIHVQVAGPKGQSKLTLKRPARSITLVR